LNDQFTVRPILIAVILLGLLFPLAYAANNFDGYPGTSILMVLVAFVTAFVDLLLLFVRLAMGRWRASISVAVALILFSGCFLARFEILLAIDHVRFRMFRDHYVYALATVADPPSANGLKVLHWGFWAHFLSGAFYRKLVYDELDEIGSSNGRLSPRVREAIRDAIQNSLSMCRTRVHRLEGHFYIVDVGC
jgi:hypothetical protein